MYIKFEGYKENFCGGLMVSALFSGASGPVSSPAGWGHCVVFLNKTFFHTMPLSTQVGTGE